MDKNIFQKALEKTKEELIFECLDQGYSLFLMKELKNALEKIFEGKSKSEILELIEEESSIFEFLETVLTEEAFLLTKLDKKTFCYQCSPFIKNLKKLLNEN